MIKIIIRIFIFSISIISISKTLNAATLTLKPDANTGKDAYLDQNTPTTNYGFHPEISSTSWNCSPNCNVRSVFQFDLSSIPTGSFITSATISLFAAPTPLTSLPGGNPMFGANQSIIQRVTSSWNENTVTWNNVPATTTQNQVTLAQSSSSNQSYLNINVKNLLQDMVNNPLASFGFMIKLTNETPLACMIFASSDASNSSLRPEITIQYQLPISITTIGTSINTLCPGSNLNIGYSVGANYNAGNIFTAQLSDMNGSFINPTAIGSLTSTSSGVIPVVIPVNAVSGSGYRIRIASSNPVTIGIDNGINLIIPTMNDGNLCTIDACNSITGSISHSLINPTDGNACTNDACDSQTGIISHIPINTNDGNACTIDLCNTQSGEISHAFVLIDDASVCTIDACNSSTGDITHTQIDYNDNNPCTIDLCDVSLGTFHIPISVSDNNACTIDDCDLVTGSISHSPVNVSDDNVCTADACNSITGITHTFENFNDNNACTNDACDPNSGPQHFIVSADDGNLCTFDFCDPQTGIYHVPVFIDDNNNCTVDACNSQTGLITHIDDTPTFITSIDPILCYGGTTCLAINAIGGLPPYAGTGTFCGYPAGTYEFEILDSRGCLTSPSSITIHQPDKLTLNITSTPSSCNGNDGSANCSETGGTAPVICVWSPGGQTGHTATNLSPGNYTVTCTDANGCIATASVVVGSSGTQVSSPGSINGPAGVCRDQSGVVFTISSVPGAVAYSWILPAGASGFSNSTSISVNFNNTYNGGFICVKAIGSCGISSSSCINVSYINSKPNTPQVTIKPPNHCPDAILDYAVGQIPLATNYTWTSTGGLTIVSGQGTSAVQVKAPSGFTSGQISITATNCKGKSGKRTIKVTGLPEPTPTINGSNSVCKSQIKTYSTGPVANATSYIWSISGGGIITSGQGTTNITIDFNSSVSTSAVVMITANNACGSSSRTKNVSVNLNCKTYENEQNDLSINENDILVYPNPSSGKINISFSLEKSTILSVDVTDILGNIVYHNIIDGLKNYNRFDIDLSNLSKGIYYLCIKDHTNELQMKKVIIE
jgi:hypothetical protein